MTEKGEVLGGSQEHGQGETGRGAPDGHLDDRRRLAQLLIVVIAIALIVAAAVIALLYRTALEQQRVMLSEIVHSQIRLIEAMARLDARYRTRSNPGGSRAATLNRVVDALRSHGGFGVSGEFVLGRREGDNIVFLLSGSGHLPQHPKQAPFATGPEAMRRALSGESGTLIRRDYRGVETVAAYEPVRELNLGLVAKIDLDEVRAPFVYAALIAAAAIVGGILLGTLLFLRVTRRMVARLRASEEHTRAIYLTVADAIITIDDRGIVQSFNGGAERMFGYRTDETVGHNVKMLMPEPYHSAHDGYLRRYRSTGEAKVIGSGCRASGRRKDGSVFPIELVVNEMRYDGRREFVGVIRDTTERTRAETTLRESEAMLAAAQQIAHMGCWSYDIAGNRVVWSDELYRIFGLEPRSSEPSYEAFLGHVHPDDRPRLIAAIAEARRRGQSFAYSYRIRHADGTERVLESHGQTFVDESGSVVRMFGVTQDVTERRRAEAALRASEERFSRVFHASPMSISISRLSDGVFLDVNEAFTRVTGWARHEAIGRSSAELGLWSEPARRENFFARIRGQGAIADAEWRVRTRSGETRDVLVSAGCIEIAGETCLLVMGLDVSDRKRVEGEMRKLSRALEQTADSVTVTDRNGVIEYVNPAFETATGYSREEVLGSKPALIKSGRQGEAFYRELWETILRGEVFSEVFVNRRKNGELYYEEKTITPLKDADGRITHFVATGRDITERVQVQERLQHLAHHDVLTELPNRALFLDRLRQALARARWHGHHVAVVFLDLDRFKNINDTLGHDAGDKLLQALAARLRASVRDGDTVARFGGDEFAILLDEVTLAHDVANVARKILAALEPPFAIEGRELYMTASAGISLYPEDGEDSRSLLKNADIAMYRAKELGKNTYQFYSAEMSASAFERLSLESSLRRALERREFTLHYQPQMDAVSGRIVGFEALLRWQHPDHGLVSPADFIPLLEETGLIVAVGGWVLETAGEQLRAWHAAGHGGLRVAVNVSARQFYDHGFLDTLERVARGLPHDAGQLEVEITESAIMRHTQAAADALNALHRLGVRLAVDDFGTGYSSMSYLRRFPIDTLKIDRSFIRDIPADPDDSAITSAIISLAQSMKLDVIAEGVETAEQRDFLCARGCNVMQGFLFSRPVPAEHVARLLSAR